MIDGFPFERETSYYWLFVDQIKKQYESVQSSIVSLGGFPIGMAAKHVKRVTRDYPDVVIIQFGAIDAKLSLRDHIIKHVLKKEPAPVYRIKESEIKLEDPLKIYLRWFINVTFKHLVAPIFKIKPLPSDSYVDSLRKILLQLKNTDAKVIILSPFVQNDYFANRCIQKYSNGILGLQKEFDFIFVDCFTPLLKFKKHEILFTDGFHLTPKGHRFIVQIIYEKTKKYHDDLFLDKV